MTLLTAPLASIDDYVAHYSARPLPVLKATVRALDDVAALGDNVSSRALAGVVLGDPMMTVRLLTHMQTHRKRAQNRDITTVERAVVMLGTGPFFKAFADLHTVEDALGAQPRALLMTLRLISLSRRSAQLARDWAVMRRDFEVEEVVMGALLADIGIIACSLHAPALMSRVLTSSSQPGGPHFNEAFYEAFGVELNPLQLALAEAWNLPELLASLIDESQADHPRVRNVTLAARFARHLLDGWQNPKITQDLIDIGRLLKIGREPLLRRLNAPDELIAQAVREASA